MKPTKLWLTCIAGIILTITSERGIVIDSTRAARDNEYLPIPAAMLGAGEHPRLFFNADEITELQADAATSHQEIWKPIRDYAELLLGTLPPASAPVDGDLDAYRKPGNQLISLAFACVITEDVDLCDLARSYLLTYAGWGQWGENNYRDLGHAHMLLGNTIAYDWLYNSLTAAERQIVQTSLASWAQKMHEASSAESDQSGWGNWWRVSYMQNHHWTNNSALGMAGLALLGEDDRAQTWIDQASSQISRVQYILNRIEDGSWHEGIPYQNYGLTMSLPFMLNLRDMHGIDILPHKYLRNYPYWRLYNLLSNQTEFILTYGNFERYWSNDYGPQGLLRFAAAEYGNGYAAWTAQQIISAFGRPANVQATPWNVFEFFYYEPTISLRAPTDLPNVRTFSDLEGIVWRTGWGENDLIFGLKSGAYGGRFGFDTFTQQLYPWACATIGCQMNIGHNHNDGNSFFMYRRGRWLVPESIGNNQYETRYHNTLLIDGQGQFRPSGGWREPEEFIGSDGFLETTANTPDFNYARADATRRYKNISGLEDITRHVLFVRPDYFIMLDSVAASAPHQFDWVSHFGESIAVEGNWVRGNAGGGQIMGVGIAAPQPFETSTGNDGQPYVRIRPASQVAGIRFINLLYPTDEASWDSRPDVTIVADTGQAALTRVQMKDGSNQRDDVVLTYTQPGSSLTVGPYEYDGQVAVLSRSAGGDIKRLFVYGGTFLTDLAANRILVAGLSRFAPIEIIYSGPTVVVTGSIFSEVTLYAPQAEELILNGASWQFTRSGDFITVEPTSTYLPIIMKGES